MWEAGAVFRGKGAVGGWVLGAGSALRLARAYVDVDQGFVVQHRRLVDERFIKLWAVRRADTQIQAARVRSHGKQSRKAPSMRCLEHAQFDSTAAGVGSVVDVLVDMHRPVRRRRSS